MEKNVKMKKKVCVDDFMLFYFSVKVKMRSNVTITSVCFVVVITVEIF